jgi:hypothetical protein
LRKVVELPAAAPKAAVGFFVSNIQSAHEWSTDMTVALASCSLLLLGTVTLLIREVRLRRALQQLLFQLLTLWRRLHAKDRPIAPNLDGTATPCPNRDRL